MSLKLSQIPTYVKVIVVIVVVALVGVVVACTAGIMMVKDSLSPGNAEKVANEMVELPSPLPRGWVYGVGIDLGYQKTASIQDTHLGRGHALIQFNQFLSRGKRSAELTASKFAMPSVAGMTFEQDSKGEEKIGGSTAYYIRQHGTVMGKLKAIEVVFIDIPGGLFEIQSTEDGLDTFDPAIVEPIIKSIKSIRMLPETKTRDTNQSNH